MRIQGCDRDCNTCPFLELCGGIKQYNIRGYRCPYADCELKAPAIKRMQECIICRMGRITWDLLEEEVVKLVSEFDNLSGVKGHPIELPSVVPMVSLRDQASYHFTPVDVDAIVIRFEDLFDEKIRNKVEKAGDIHAYLNFDGKVLVSSIMPDDLITQEAVFYFFLDLVDRLKFDAAIAWDSPVYVDIPLYDSWVNLLMGLKLTHELAEWGIPVYGLVKGNVENQIRFSVKTLARIGITSMALHASEYSMVLKVDSTVRQILYTYSRYLSESAESVLLLGVLNPKQLSFIENTFPRGPKRSIAGLSWFLDAKRGLIYSDRGYVDATANYVQCKCSVCFNINPKDLILDLGARARHNLNYVMNNVANPSASPLQLVTYDLLLGENEKILLVSDLHLWTRRTLLKAFLDFLKDEKPTHIAFLGDVFDLKGRPNLLETRAFFSTLRELKALVLVAKGCSDTDDFLSAFEKLTMGGRPKLMLWSKLDDPHLTQAYIDLYRFYVSAKEQLTIKLANGWWVITTHGHEIVEDTSSSAAEIAELMEDARMRAHAHWLIMGHLHRAFVDDNRRIASTGCWARAGPYESRKTRKDNLMTSIVVHGDGKVELKRRG